MGIASQSTHQQFPFPQIVVFRAAQHMLPRAGMTITSSDEMLGRIWAKTGMSAFSWGENISLLIEAVDEKSCVMSLDSDLKVGINITAAGKHRQNFQKIIYQVSQCLKYWQDQKLI